MMDMRAFSKGYWSYFERAQERYGISTPAAASALREDPPSHDLILRYQDDGRRATERFDLVVLSVGMEISESVKRDLGRRLGIELDEYGFCHTVQFNPLETSRPGIYAAGPFREPKDIPESVVEASAPRPAAVRLAPARFTLTTRVSYPGARRDRRGAAHRRVRLPLRLEHRRLPGCARRGRVRGDLPGVVHAEHNLYTCSQDSIAHITEQVQAAGPEPRGGGQLHAAHPPTAVPGQHARGRAEPYLFEMANIRNQCSWVHSDDWDAATAKAHDLVRMAVARAALLEPQHTVEVPVQQAALVVGGGAAGMTAALSWPGRVFPCTWWRKRRSWAATCATCARYPVRRRIAQPAASWQELVEQVWATR
jgi:heterodisulfide reductase subunit A2